MDLMAKPGWRETAAVSACVNVARWNAAAAADAASARRMFAKNEIAPRAVGAAAVGTS
jgi:hypothetical protein